MSSSHKFNLCKSGTTILLTLRKEIEEKVQGKEFKFPYRKITPTLIKYVTLMGYWLISNIA